MQRAGQKGTLAGAAQDPLFGGTRDGWDGGYSLSGIRVYGLGFRVSDLGRVAGLGQGCEIGLHGCFHDAAF